MRESEILSSRRLGMAEGQEEIPAIRTKEELTPFELEIQNIVNAIDHIDRKATSNGEGLTRADVLDLNKIAMDDPLNPHRSGVLRKGPAEVRYHIKGEFKRTPVKVAPGEVGVLFDSYCEKLFEISSEVGEATPVGEVINMSSWAHTELVRIHPFYDGNGRTARLLGDFIFKKASLPYITDWGAEDDEYREVVDKMFREGDPVIFEGFLCRKLIARCQELVVEEPEIKAVIGQISDDTREYFETLKQNVS